MKIVQNYKVDFIGTLLISWEFQWNQHSNMCIGAGNVKVCWLVKIISLDIAIPQTNQWSLIDDFMATSMNVLKTSILEMLNNIKKQRILWSVEKILGDVDKWWRH